LEAACERKFGREAGRLGAEEYLLKLAHRMTKKGRKSL
jgi:hypothetical protein